MQIVIDMPEEMFEWVNDVNKFYKDYDVSDFIDVIKNGTVLSKHGDLVDRSEIEVEEDVYNQTYIIHAPTVLEATEVSE